MARITTTKTEREFNILVYGIEKKGIDAPISPIITPNYILTFGAFNTSHRFDDYNGLIIFQGIFETIRNDSRHGTPYIYCVSETNELDKRQKEVELLLNNKGFVCFILCERFIENSHEGPIKSTDLAKRYLNHYCFDRDNFNERTIRVEAIRSEFERFFIRFGGAWSFFMNSNDRLDMRVLAKVASHNVGIILKGNQFYVPSLIPDKPFVEEYFKLLASAVTSTCKKLVYEVPEWADAFDFPGESKSKEEKEKFLNNVEEIDNKLLSLQRYKRILLLDGDLLVEAVVEVLRDGFGLNVEQDEEYREDIKLLDDNNEPIVFVEIKGTNRGVKNEYINQCDTHRERAELPSSFPSILIINTHIKRSYSIEDKDKEINTQQVQHAKRNKVLILRTLDLLRLLKHLLNNKINKEMFITLMKSEYGWLKATNESWEIINI